MSQVFKRYLKVGGAPKADENELIVRIHPDDKPKGINWGDYIHLSTNRARITCKLRSNELREVEHPRIHQININRGLRNILGIRTGTVYNFYISKASSWKAPSYIMHYHPKSTVRRNMRLKIYGAIAGIIVIIGVYLYALIWY